MIKKYFATLIIAALPIVAAAQTASFLNLSPDSRSLAMGGTYALTETSRALAPEVIDAEVTYIRWQPQGMATGVMNIEGSYRYGRVAPLVQVRLHGGGEYPIMDGYGTQTGSYIPHEMMFGFGAAYALSGKAAVSAVAKHVSSSHAPDAAAYGFCADLGFLWRFSDRLSAGILASSLGPEMKFTGESSSYAALPAQIKAGAESTLPFGKDARISLAADAGYMTIGARGTFAAAAGAECLLAHMIALRAGYHFAADSTIEPSYLTAGLGICLPGTSIGATYLMNSTAVSGSFCITLGLEF